jgi:hypothetical protein
VAFNATEADGPKTKQDGAIFFAEALRIEILRAGKSTSYPLTCCFDNSYGKADLREQKSHAACMTFILTCIIYWQAPGKLTGL